MVTHTNCDDSVSESRSVKAKKKYRVSLRYKQFTIEELILTKVEKAAVIHFLYILSRAMKREGDKCPFYYKWEEI